MAPLLAKSSRRDAPAVTLLEHSLDTERAIDAIFPADSRWYHAWLRFFRIPAERSSTYWKTLRITALLHDVGKANEDFQLAVTTPGAPPQSLRHEHLSAALLCSPGFRSWFTNGGVNPDVVIAAVLSHHIKASAASNDRYAWCLSRNKPIVKLFFNDPDVITLLRHVADHLGTDQIPTIPSTVWQNDEPWSSYYEFGQLQSQRFRRALRKNLEDESFLSALKAGLIVIDAVASAIVREGKSLKEWLTCNAHLSSISPEDIETAIIKPRANAVTRGTGRVFELHSFQKLVAEEGSRTLLLAPCGSGKTLAAWQWAKKQALTKQFGRVIFLYPTRGTATEGFRDYVAWAPEGEGTLLHGSSTFELASMASNPPESLDGKDVSTAEAEARLFALGLWRFRFFSATVDQFLSFMQNRYQSLCLLPILADSVVIIDEVHSYDMTMFTLLNEFLVKFDIPVLCMTATLPKRRFERMENSHLLPFPRPEHQTFLTDLSDSAQCPRYRIRQSLDPKEAIEEAANAYLEGKRVLVVVNRVARCIEVARHLESKIGTLPLVYHSRFRLMDRQESHRNVVEAFKRTEPSIAVTTQVCEMSLDLDAQYLVTETAPVPSLIQRFGRANRHLRERRQLADIVVYAPAKHAPYERDELELATQFIAKVAGVASQSDLTEALESGEFSSPEAFLADSGQFLTGGYFAVPGSFRDDDDLSKQCICDGDLPTVERLYREGKPIDGYILPAPKNKQIDRPNTILPPHIGLVSSSDYNELIGLQV